MNLRVLISFACLLLFPATLSAQVVYEAHTKVKLITDVASIQPGAPFWVGVHMQMDKDWHVYWKNPGDSGLAPSVKWRLPEGFKVGEIQWPYPKRISLGPLTSFGYEDEVILWSQVFPPPKLSIPSADITAKVEWLACKVECIPGQGVFSLALPVGESPPTKNSEASQALENSRLLWPVEDENVNLWAFRAKDTGEKFVIEFWTSRNSKTAAKNVVFFPNSDKLIEHAAPQRLEQNPITYYVLTLSKSHLITNPPMEIQGILMQDYGWDEEGRYRAMEIKLPVEYLIPSRETAAATPIGIILACGFAFLGGLILNLMPCVLPVLSLKIIGLVKSASNHRKIITSGLIFTAGVLVSFWILAGILVALQSVGHQLGWGFQFQSPVFVAVIASILFVLGLNFLGVFEINLPISLEQPATQGYLGNFLSGVLATVVATPCTAPFMGTAISFALAQPASVAFLIFTFLGLGMASPYLLLCFFPGALRFLPKPGGWMIGLKAVLGFMLLACVIWLGWVLALQKGLAAVVVLSLGLWLMGIGLWFWGFRPLEKKNHLVAVMIWVVIVIGFLVTVGGMRIIPSQGRSLSTDYGQEGIHWREFSPELLAQLRSEGKPVFIDFIAAWCLTCQVNDRLVFQNKKVVEAFQNLGIIGLKADWTNHSEVITQALAGYGKNSIPLYVFYGNQEQPVILPELVTPDLVIDKLNQHIIR